MRNRGGAQPTKWKMYRQAAERIRAILDRDDALTGLTGDEIRTLEQLESKLNDLYRQRPGPLPKTDTGTPHGPTRRQAAETLTPVREAMEQATGIEFDEWMAAARVVMGWQEACDEILSLTGIRVPRPTLMWWYPELRAEKINPKRRAVVPGIDPAAASAGYRHGSMRPRKDDHD